MLSRLAYNLAGFVCRHCTFVKLYANNPELRHCVIETVTREVPFKTYFGHLEKLDEIQYHDENYGLVS